MDIDEALQRARELHEACRSDPGLWNILRAEQEWALYGDACDPLSPSAPEFALKALQRDIYLETWSSFLARIPADARTMVAGGGTGRFARALADRKLRVELVDASPEAVRRARRHLGGAAIANVGDVSRPNVLERGAYDLVVAVEVACYATDPTRVMDQLGAALRSGGILLFSVEARPGALLADADLRSPEAHRAVLNDGVITLPGHKHVHYYTRAEAGALAERAGLRVLAVDGVCYVPDGPFGSLIDATRLHEPSYAEEIKNIERQCSSHALLRELPRAWAVAAAAP
jgi:SAM-dependent methyltransferase